MGKAPPPNPSAVVSCTLRAQQRFGSGLTRVFDKISKGTERLEKDLGKYGLDDKDIENAKAAYADKEMKVLQKDPKYIEARQTLDIRESEAPNTERVGVGL